MEIIQKPITANHKSAMFFDGVIAQVNTEFGLYSLETFQDGELVYDGKLYIGAEIKELIGIINDESIEDEVSVDIHVDKFITIKFNDKLVDEDYLMFDNYDDAMTAFKAIIGEV